VVQNFVQQYYMRMRLLDIQILILESVRWILNDQLAKIVIRLWGEDRRNMRMGGGASTHNNIDNFRNI